MGIGPDAERAVGAAVPHDRHDRGRAGAGPPDPRAPRGPARPRGASSPGDPRDARGGRTGRLDRLRDLRARRPRGRGDPARGGRRGGARRATLTAEQAFELSLAPPARGLVIGITHEGATAATNAALEARATRPARTAVDHRQPPLAGGRAWPRSSSRPTSSTTAGATPSATSARSWRRPRSARTCPVARSTARPSTRLARRRARATRPRRGRSPRPSPMRRSSSSSRPARTGRPAASSSSRSRRRRGCRRPTATSRRSCTATCPRPDRTTGLVLVLTDRDRRDERVARARQALAAARVIGLRAGAIVAADLDGALDPALTPAGRLLVPEAPDLPARWPRSSAPRRRSSS